MHQFNFHRKLCSQLNQISKKQTIVSKDASKFTFAVVYVRILMLTFKKPQEEEEEEEEEEQQQQQQQQKRI